jgi:peptide/nickel transport system substrate-binding protein
MRAMTLVSPVVLALVLAGACGGALTGTPAHAQSPGGHLDVFSAADVDSLDPGDWNYTYDYMALGQTTQRWLYAWEPGKTVPTPDVAAGMPQTSADGKTVTVKIRPGIRYSAPLVGRTVTAADVAYAFTRDLDPRTANGYASLYYANIVGARNVLAGRTEKLAGVEAPDATTLVIRLVRPTGAISTAQALALPGTSPVPEDYAKRHDRGSETTYGEHQVFTGPYVITGYRPGKRIELARNPEWNGRETGDFRPAYLDSITFLGGEDLYMASRKILTGTRMVSGDFDAPPQILDSAPPDQVVSQPADTVRFIALNTRIRPFGNVNVRRAVAAIVNKQALRATRGGPRLGAVATHFLPPGIPGFDEAGGATGPGFDFTRNPKGNVRLARAYLRKAGYRSGRYNGRLLLMVGDNLPPASKTGEALQAQLEKLGFKLNYRQVQHPTMLSKFCGWPKAAVAICPNVAWSKDFFDAQSFLDPVFNGANITSTSNYNYAEIDNPRINRELSRANVLTDPAARARIYAQVDRQITSQAYVIPWFWDNGIMLRAGDVDGVVSRLSSLWDLTFTAVQ